MAIEMLADTYTYQGTFAEYETRVDGTFWVDVQYDDKYTRPEGTEGVDYTRTYVDGFAAVNAQDPEGNGIIGVYATESEAEQALIEAYGDEIPDEDAKEMGLA